MILPIIETEWFIPFDTKLSKQSSTLPPSFLTFQQLRSQRNDLEIVGKAFDTDHGKKQLAHLQRKGYLGDYKKYLELSDNAYVGLWKGRNETFLIHNRIGEMFATYLLFRSCGVKFKLIVWSNDCEITFQKSGK